MIKGTIKFCFKMLLKISKCGTKFYLCSLTKKDLTLLWCVLYRCLVCCRFKILLWKLGGDRNL